MATVQRERRRGPARVDDEAALARRALAGDREAFDRLYDRYFPRVARCFRDRRPDEAQALIWETLEQIFKGLDTTDPPLAERAYRIARASSRAGLRDEARAHRRSAP
jgi:hypothetical protein